MMPWKITDALGTSVTLDYNPRSVQRSLDRKVARVQMTSAIPFGVDEGIVGHILKFSADLVTQAKVESLMLMAAEKSRQPIVLTGTARYNAKYLLKELSVKKSEDQIGRYGTDLALVHYSPVGVLGPYQISPSAYTQLPHQRHWFYAKGLHWVFTEENNWPTTFGEGYRTSADGETWSDFVQLTGIGRLGCIDVWYDEAADYAHITTTYGTNYRRGRPKSDGIFEWSADWQSTSADSTTGASICADINGFPFVLGWHKENSYGYPTVWKSSTNDGTWNLESGWPKTIGPSGNLYNNHILLPLANGNVYAVWNFQSDGIKGSLWNGTSWTPEVILAPAPNMAETAAVKYNNDIFVVYNVRWWTQAKPTYARKRTWGSGWGSVETVDSEDTRSCPSLSIKDGNKVVCVYVHCAYDGSLYRVYYKVRENGVWGDRQTAFDAPTGWRYDPYEHAGGHSFSDSVGQEIFRENISDPHQQPVDFFQIAL